MDGAYALSHGHVLPGELALYLVEAPALFGILHQQSADYGAERLRHLFGDFDLAFPLELHELGLLALE